MPLFLTYTFLSWFILWPYNFLVCTEYVVVKIGGQVQYRSSTNVFRAIKLGDRINISQQENFKFSKDAWLQLCAPGCGLKYLKGTVDTQDRGSLSDLLSDIGSLLSASSTRRVTGRKGIEDLQRFFAVSRDRDRPGRFLIIDQGEFAVDDPQFPQNVQQFFKLTYTYRQQFIEKKLPFSGNRLLINQAEIYQINNQAVVVSEVTDMKLVYSDGRRNVDQYICRFLPVFVSSDALATDLNPLIQTMQRETTAVQLYENYVLPYIQFNYGQPDEQFLKIMLRKRFQIKSD